MPLAALAFGRLPGAGLGFAKPLGLLLVTWLVWLAGSLGVAPYGPAAVVGARRCCVAGVLAGCAASLRRAGRRAGDRLVGATAGGLGGGARAAARTRRGGAVDRRGDRVRRRVPRDGAAGRLLARRLGDREADGHGVHQRRDRRDLLPAARPVAGGRGRSTTTTSATSDGDGADGSWARRRRGLQPRHRARRWRCRRRPSFTLGGTLWAAARPRLAGVRGGPLAAGVAAVARVHRARQPGGRASVADAAGPRATSTGSRRRA